MEDVRHEVGSSFSDEVCNCGEGVDMGWGDTDSTRKIFDSKLDLCGKFLVLFKEVLDN